MLKDIIAFFRNFINKYHLYAFREVAIFMFILLFFHFIFKLFVSDITANRAFNSTSEWMAERVYYTSKWILDALNVKVTAFEELTIGSELKKRVFYYAENNGAVFVNHSCSGLKQFYQWIVLLLLYPGPWRHKTWFIPMGLIVIHLVNLFRIVSMALVTIYVPQHWHFTHDYILRPFFYVVMFILWVWWNEKFYLNFKKRKQERQAEISSAP
jgi:exosortase/archaeosortase family protein